MSKYQFLSVSEGLNELLSILKHINDFQIYTAQIAVRTSLTIHRFAEKLGNTTIHEHTGAQLKRGELQQLREHAVNTERNKRSKRIQKEVNQRSWDLEQVKKARQGIFKRPLPRIVQKTRKKLILALPYKRPN